MSTRRIYSIRHRIGAHMGVYGADKCSGATALGAAKSRMNLRSKIAPMFLISALVLSFGVHALPCTEALTTGFSQRVKDLISHKKYQEAAWNLAESGKKQEARKLEEILGSILRTDNVIASEAMPDSTQKVTLITLESGIKGVWRQFGDERGQREIANSIFDRLFNEHMVPLTVERVFKGKRGSMQYYYSRMVRSDRASLGGHQFSADYFFHDFVTDQCDAHPEYGPVRKDANLGFRSRTREILIDNQDSFTIREPMDEPLGDETMRELWKETIVIPVTKLGLKMVDIAPTRRRLEEIRAVSDDEMRSAFRGLVGAVEIEQVIQRRNFYVLKMGRILARQP